MPAVTGAAADGFRDRVRSGELLVGSFVNLGSTLTAEIMGIAGFDWVVIDLEHGGGDEFATLAQLQALAHTGAAPLVRVEGVERARFGRVLDHGAAGIIVPRVEGADDAALAVEYCRYSGRRGVARYNRSWHWGLGTRSLADVDAEVVCAVQIETASALDDVDRIAAIEGADVLFVGAADLAHSLGLAGGPTEPALLERLEAVVAAAREHGKAAGVLVGSIEQAEVYAGRGFRFLGCSSDGGLLVQSARQTADGLRQLKEVRVA
jgi:2-dehydro-3-deoxyglucarate aldolase/4-hydroxy-2-oxoheptanedioate aldolase